MDAKKLKAQIESHTAHLFVGSVAEAERMLSEAGITHATHGADFDVFKKEQITIGDVRTIKERAAMRPLALPKKYLLIELRRITHDSQHALLKLIEEPLGSSVLIFAAPEEGILIDTVRSRLQVLRGAGSPGSSPELLTEASGFLAATIGERQSVIADLLKRDDREAVQSFVDALEDAYHPHFRAHYTEQNTTRGMRALLTVRNYLTDQSPSYKQLLEHLASTLPRVG